MQTFRRFLARSVNWLNRITAHQLLEVNNIGTPQKDPDFSLDIYRMAFVLAGRMACDYVIFIRLDEEAATLLHLEVELDVAASGDSGHIQIDPQFPRLLWDMRYQPPPELPVGILERSVIVCDRVIERLPSPEILLSALKKWQRHASCILVATIDRNQASSSLTTLPASFPAMGKWNLMEFKNLLIQFDLTPDQVGFISNEIHQTRNSVLALIWREEMSKNSFDVPEGFRVLAIMATYNDEDIIIPILSKLVQSGVQVHVMDGWSTDRTWERLILFKNENSGMLVGLERFPDSPSEQNFWAEVLQRKAEIAAEAHADWYIHVDSDEIRLSPWPELSLRDAIYRVDQEGYNAIDFTLINFFPINEEEYPDQADPETYFRYFSFGRQPQIYPQIKAWKSQPRPVDLVTSGGHSVQFEGRKIYPYKFLMKHYRVLSQTHGERKIFLTRLPRTQKMREMGWGIHYESFKQGDRFYRDPTTLSYFDEDFFVNYLGERLMGLGLD